MANVLPETALQSDLLVLLSPQSALCVLPETVLLAVLLANLKDSLNRLMHEDLLTQELRYKWDDELVGY